MFAGALERHTARLALQWEMLLGGVRWEEKCLTLMIIGRQGGRPNGSSDILMYRASRCFSVALALPLHELQHTARNTFPGKRFTRGTVISKKTLQRMNFCCSPPLEKQTGCCCLLAQNSKHSSQGYYSQTSSVSSLLSALPEPGVGLACIQPLGCTLTFL